MEFEQHHRVVFRSYRLPGSRAMMPLCTSYLLRPISVPFHTHDQRGHSCIGSSRADSGGDSHFHPFSPAQFFFFVTRKLIIVIFRLYRIYLWLLSAERASTNCDRRPVGFVLVVPRSQVSNGKLDFYLSCEIFWPRVGYIECIVIARAPPTPLNLCSARFTSHRRLSFVQVAHES